MSEIRVKQHPTLGILVCTDGHILIPKNGSSPQRWSLGSKNKKGYFRIKVNYKSYMVHRLVAETFLQNPCNFPTVDHIDRNPSNNKINNLRWASYKMQADNHTNVFRGLSKYNVRACQDINAYARAMYHNNPEYRKRQLEYKRTRREMASEPAPV